VCLLLAALGLVVFWRRDTAAERWIAQMRAKGEKFTYAELASSGRFPNFVSHRVVGQSLHEMIMVELRRNDLTAAHPDLLTLIRLCRLNFRTTPPAPPTARRAPAPLLRRTQWSR
jgi:hypothetical protein